MVHVVHVLHSLDIGGTEQGVANLLASLSGGFRHTVVSMTSQGPLAARMPPGVAVHALGKRPGWDLAALVRLARLLRRARPDIVHSRNWGAADAIPAARAARVPVVLHGEHGREVFDPHGLDPRRNRVRRLLAPLVTRFVTVSHDLHRWLVDVVAIPTRKVVTIHNGVDIARFCDDGREAGRRALGLRPDAVVVGTVGRLDPVKDQLGLLEAFAGASGVTDLVIVGDGICRQPLAQRAALPDLAGRVHLLGERSDIALLLKGLDVFALPSIAEGISNTILEAMATGLPVIATATGGNPELVEDGVTGALVPVGDRAALSRALTRYARAPELRAAHGRAARRRVMDHFSLGTMARRYRDLYLTLAAGRGA